MAALEMQEREGSGNRAVPGRGHYVWSQTKEQAITLPFARPLRTRPHPPFAKWGQPSNLTVLLQGRNDIVSLHGLPGTDISISFFHSPTHPTTPRDPLKYIQ